MSTPSYPERRGDLWTAKEALENAGYELFSAPEEDSEPENPGTPDLTAVTTIQVEVTTDGKTRTLGPEDENDETDRFVDRINVIATIRTADGRETPTRFPAKIAVSNPDPWNRITNCGVILADGQGLTVSEVVDSLIEGRFEYEAHDDPGEAAVAQRQTFEEDAERIATKLLYGKNTAIQILLCRRATRYLAPILEAGTEATITIDSTGKAKVSGVLRRRT